MSWSINTSANSKLSLQKGQTLWTVSTSIFGHLQSEDNFTVKKSFHIEATKFTHFIFNDETDNGECLAFGIEVENLKKSFSKLKFDICFY